MASTASTAGGANAAPSPAGAPAATEEPESSTLSERRKRFAARLQVQCTGDASASEAMALSPKVDMWNWTYAGEWTLQASEPGTPAGVSNHGDRTPSSGHARGAPADAHCLRLRHEPQKFTDFLRCVSDDQSQPGTPSVPGSRPGSFIQPGTPLGPGSRPGSFISKKRLTPHSTPKLGPCSIAEWLKNGGGMLDEPMTPMCLPQGASSFSTCDQVTPSGARKDIEEDTVDDSDGPESAGHHSDLPESAERSAGFTK